MRTHKYPSDVTDEQGALIEPLIPVYPGGRPRPTDVRDVLDAICYLRRTGCPWRYLPKDFPPQSTVGRSFDAWRPNGTREEIHDTLRDQVRRQEKPRHPRRSARMDSQSVPTSPGGEAVGRDNAPHVTGRKRHLVVDSLGLLLAGAVTAARVDDAAAAPEVLAQRGEQPLPRLRRGYADPKYPNHAWYGWVDDNASWELDIVRRPQGTKGWVRLPIRWTVERTLAWRKQCRRLSVDREKSTRSAEAMIRLAMIHRMLNRLCPKPGDTEFHYRKAG